MDKMLEYLKALKLEAKADNLRHNDWLEGFGTKQGDALKAKEQIAKDMNSQMRLGEEGNMQINANDVAVPDSVRQNELRKAGLETNVETPGLDNSQTNRIDSSRAEWAAEQAAYDAEREAARLAGVKERWLAKMAKDKEDALRNNEVVEKKIVEIEPTNDYQSMILDLEAKKAAKTEALAEAKKKGGAGSKSGTSEVLAKKAATREMNIRFDEISSNSHTRFRDFIKNNSLRGFNIRFDTLKRMVYDKWVNPATAKNPVSFDEAVNKLRKLDGTHDFKVMFPNANKNTGQLRTIEKSRLKRIEADKLEADALKILKEEEERLVRRTKDSGTTSHKYTGDQEFDIGPDGSVIPTKKKK